MKYYVYMNPSREDLEVIKQYNSSLSIRNDHNSVQFDDEELKLFFHCEMFEKHHNNTFFDDLS